MPDLLDASGLQIKTRTEIRTDLVDGTSDYPGLKGIYGSDINLEANSPDAQMVEIFTQAAIDLRELLASVFNSFDPDRAVGRILDARCAINGVYRNAGTYTEVLVNVTTDRSVALPGLDNFDVLGAFTVSDSTGNKFALMVSTAVTAGATSLRFRATKLGFVDVAAHALTFISTPTLGVLSVDNASVPIVAGTDEETDAQFRLRRARTMALPARGTYDAMLSAVNAVESVVQAVVYENTTNATDARGVPAHGAWVIVDGGADADVGAALYPRIPLGLPLRGAVSVPIVQQDGTVYNVLFDRPTPQLLYVSVNIAPTSGAIDYSGLGYRFLEQMSYGIGADADVTTVVAKLRELQANVLVTSEGVSLDGVTYAATVSPTTVDKQFYLTDTSIKINGTLLNAL